MEAYNKFRVRKGWFGKSILQQLVSHPAIIGNSIDSSIREYQWRDVVYDRAPESFYTPIKISDAYPNESSPQ